MEEQFIADSKLRCLEFGLQADVMPISKNPLSSDELEEIQHKYKEVISVMDFFGDKTTQLLEGIPVLMTLTDNLGYIISFAGNETIRETVNQLGLIEGVQMSESGMGTNSIFLALQQKKPVGLLGGNHFHLHFHSSACYSVPFYFEDVDHLVGTVSMMTLLDFHSAFAMPLLSNMVDSMGREIALRRKNRNQDLLNHMMINSVNNGIIITDKNGNILEFNQLIEKITSCKRENVIGNSILSFEAFAEYMQGVLTNGMLQENIECTFYLPQNKRMICLLDAIPILDDRTELIGAYLQIRDITERSELEKQIITYEKFSAIGKLAAGIAHEIRNPLTTIMGFIQLLVENKDNQDNAPKYLNIVYKELLDLNKMVSDFVLMAKPSSPEKKVIILQTLIQDTVQFMTIQANLKGTILKTDLYSFPITICIDAIQMKQVLINLIQNAFEAMPDGGEVEIGLSVDPKNNNAIISISDTGVGIIEEQLKEIFNPFFTTKDNGLGLGLSICYRIVENHNGKILMKSILGSGTQFNILLPI